MTSPLPSFFQLLVITVLLPLLINSAPIPVKQYAEGTADDLLNSVLEYLRDLSELKHGPDVSSYDLHSRDGKVVSSDSGLDGLGEEGETEEETVTEKSVNPRRNLKPFPTSPGIPDYKKRGSVDLKHQLLEQARALGQQVEQMIQTLEGLIH